MGACTEVARTTDNSTSVHTLEISALLANEYVANKADSVISGTTGRSLAQLHYKVFHTSC